MIARKLLLLSVSVIAILVSSTMLVAVPAIPRASAQQLAQIPREERNWEYVYHDQQGTNYSPQKQITKDNVKFLELKWLFPFPNFIQGGTGFYSRGNPVMGTVPQGFVTSPLIIDGIIYTASSMWDVFALDAATGKLLWKYTPEIKMLCINIPVNKDNQNCFLGARHMHSLTYAEGKIFLMTNLNGWGDIILLDALSGKVSLHVPDYTKDIPGQRYPENGRYGMAHEWGPTIYKKENLMIVQAATIDYNTRGFLRAYDLSTGRLVWSWYAVPPAPDCKWEPKQANDARKGNIDPALAVGDWGTKCDLNGAPGVWGHVSVDEEAGRVYFGTSGPYPTSNATHRPGPNLYGDVIGALDAKSGDLIWYFQTTTHDINGEQDCKEGTMLMKGATVQGQKRNLVWNLCRAFNYILDADTGKLVYTYDRWEKKAQGTDPRKVPMIGNNMGNQMNMKIRWWEEPKTSGFTPHFGGNGGYAGYDPKSNTIFFKSTASAGAPAQILNVDFDGGKYDKTWALPIFSQGSIGDPTIAQKYPATNEFVAWDMNTGQVKWKKDFDRAATRGGVTVTSGMVFGGFADGVLRAWDTETGRELWTKSFGTGAGIITPPTFGATSEGKIAMVQIYGGSGAISLGSNIPGALMVFGLPDSLPQPQVITKEVIKEVPKEVIKEVVKTVTVEMVSPISYAAIGIAVVLVVIAGVLFTRRKKV
jgi:alcohol dehydrogenase (cytochrome c)